MSITFSCPHPFRIHGKEAVPTGLFTPGGFNVSNANAVHLLVCLGYDEDVTGKAYGELEPLDVLERIKKLSKAMHEGRGSEFRRPSEVRKNDGHIKMFDIGVDEYWLLERLHDLEDLCLSAAHTHVMVSWS